MFDVAYCDKAIKYCKEMTTLGIIRIQEILAENPKAKILDVGGGDQPLNISTYVIDIQPYTDKPRFGYQGFDKVEKPRITANNWIKHDICDYPWPFKDKEFDFIFCSQTLEDVRDPIGVCKEMARVGKEGFVVCPGKYLELMRPMNQMHEADKYNGFWHHRWLVFIEGEGKESKVIFEQKDAFGG